MPILRQQPHPRRLFVHSVRLLQSVYEFALDANGQVRLVELERRVSRVEEKHDDYGELKALKKKLPRLEREYSEEYQPWGRILRGGIGLTLEVLLAAGIVT